MDQSFYNQADSALSTRQRLIFAALSLYAEKGIESVSMRMINNEAEMRNTSAMHYHFGTKLKLHQAIIAFIQDWFLQQGGDAVAELKARSEGETVPLRDVLEAFMAPYEKMLIQEPWGVDALLFLNRAELGSNQELLDILATAVNRSVERFVPLLEKSLPHISRDTLSRRFTVFMMAVMHGLGEVGRTTSVYFYQQNLSCREVVDMYLETYVPAISAPEVQTAS